MYDEKRAFGFIKQLSGTDVFYHLNNCIGPLPAAGETVTFDLTVEGGKQKALNVRLKFDPYDVNSFHIYSRLIGAALTSWSFIPLRPQPRQPVTALEDLASKCLFEHWDFGTIDTDKRYPILENYLRFTFLRLLREKKVISAALSGKSYALFNTGLVDHLYDTIYALFERNPREGAQPWIWIGFAVPGKGQLGKLMTSVFNPLPPPAEYFNNNFDMLLDTNQEIHVEYDHVILDGVSRNRYPFAFLEAHKPKNFEWRDYRSMDPVDQRAYLGDLADAIEKDLSCFRSMKGRIEDAMKLAEKRIRWNYKTAIPQYHPRHDEMSFLIPISIIDDEKVDMSLVVTRNPSGSYQGRTVFPLSWSYMNARLVCRPDSDWLSPEMDDGKDLDGDEPDLSI